MKFGKELRARLYKPWAKYYVAYKKLKKLINKANDPRKSPGAKSKYKSEFFQKCFNDIKKAEEFYKKTLANLLASYNKYVSKFQKNTTEAGEPKSSRVAIGILKDLKKSITLLEKMEEFCILNSEGFRKIVKKWDKRMEESELAGFMVQVKLQSFFRHDGLNWLKQNTSDLHNKVDEQIKGPGHRILEGGKKIGVLVKHSNQTYIIPMSPLTLPSSHPDATPIALTGTVDECLILDSGDMTKAEREFHDFLVEPESDTDEEGEAGEGAPPPLVLEGRERVKVPEDDPWQSQKYESMFEPRPYEMSSAERKSSGKIIGVFEELQLGEGAANTPSSRGSKSSLSILEVLNSPADSTDVWC